MEILGSANQMAGELLKINAKIDIVHVPYKGSAPAIYHNDHSRPETPKIRSLDEEIARVVRARRRSWTTTSRRRPRRWRPAGSGRWRRQER